MHPKYMYMYMNMNMNMNMYLTLTVNYCTCIYTHIYTCMPIVHTCMYAFIAYHVLHPFGSSIALEEGGV